MFVAIVTKLLNYNLVIQRLFVEDLKIKKGYIFKILYKILKLLFVN